MLENVNKPQLFTVFSIKCSPTQVRLPYESNQFGINSQDDNRIPIGDLIRGRMYEAPIVTLTAQ